MARDPSNDEIPVNKKLRDDAVGWVLQYERQHGRKPIPQPHNNPGYDVFSSGQSEVRYIEVKGIRSEWDLDGVPISVKQFECASNKGDAFWLFVVEFADDPECVTIHPIQNPVALINQFRFDDGWRALATKETPFRPLVPGPGLLIRVRDKQAGVREGKIKSVKTDSAGEIMMQIEWSNGHHGGLAFEPLKVEILSNPASGI
jgi:hypothetical protein